MTERYDWSALPEDELDRIAGLHPEAVVREVLSRDPHTSGTELVETLAGLGHTVTKAQAQRWRQAWRDGPRPAPPPDRPEAGGPEALADSMTQAQVLLEERIRVGDEKGAKAWAEVIARLASVPTAGQGLSEGPADWTRLTEREAEVMHYLTAKAHGSAPADDEERLEREAWAALIAGGKHG